jgi:GT2 family glycosyltransferase
VTRTVATGRETPCILSGPGQSVSALPDPPPAPRPAGPLVPRPRVTAVLVTRGGSEHLPRTTAALAAQTRSPDVLVAVQAGGLPQDTDRLREIAGHVLHLEGRVCFGDGVRAGLAALDSLPDPSADPRPPDPDPLPPQGKGRRGEPGPASWVWLVHDDCAPFPDALARLLNAVERGPSIGVAGCKQVSWEDDQQLRDVGFTTSRLGTRVTGLDLFEVDQGQHDGRSDMLAVCEAGMLVRRDVWDVLGGTDPALGRTRVDLDLCRRARLAGHRVVVVPEAVVAHAGRSTVGDLPPRGSTYRADRRAVLHLRLVGTPLPLLPLIALAALAVAPLRAVAGILTGKPLRALDEFWATGRVLAGPVSLIRARRRLRSVRRVPRRTLRPLLATRRQLWLHRCNGSVLRRAAGRGRPRRTPNGAGRPEGAPVTLSWSRGKLVAGCPPGRSPRRTRLSTGSDVETLPVPDAPACEPVAESVAGAPGRTGLPVRSRGMTGDRSPLGSRRGSGPAVLSALLVTGTAALVALRELLRPGTPQGPWLMPVPDTAGQLWRSATGGWRSAGLGSSAVADPADLVLALLARLVGGDPDRAVTLLLLAGAPLSALVGYWAAGRFTAARAVRWWAALGWGCAPTLLTALAQGRPAGVLAHVLLPLPALAVARVLTAARTWDLGGRRGERHHTKRDTPHLGSLRAALAAGLLLTPVLACAPSLAVPTVGILTVLVVVSGRRGPMLLVTLLLPLALLLPWWWAVAGDRSLLLADPAPAGGPDSPWWHLLGHPASPWGLVEPAAAVLRGLVAPGVPVHVLALGLVLVTAGPTLLLAGAALARGGSAGRGAAVAWGIALLGMVTAVAAERVGTGNAHGAGRADPGISLFTVGVLAAALCLWTPRPGRGRPTGHARAREGGRGRARATTVGILFLALTGPLTTLALWTGQCSRGGGGVLGVRAAPADVLPGLAAAEGNSPAATRTLVLRVDEQQVSWSLTKGIGPRLGDTSAALRALSARGTGASQDGSRAPNTGEIVRPVVAELLSGTERDLRGDLADLGVGSVYVLGPVGDLTANALDSSPGLVRTAVDASGSLWRVEPEVMGGRAVRPAWARVLDGRDALVTALPSSGESIDTRLPAGAGGRTLVLSARRDPGWRASLDGRPLTPVIRGEWAQAFELTDSGGRLVVRHDGPDPAGSGPVRGLVVLLALVFLLPVRVPRRRQVLLPRPSRPVLRGQVGAVQAAPPAPRVYDDEHPERGDLAPVLTDPPRRSRRRPAGGAQATAAVDRAGGNSAGGRPAGGSSTGGSSTGGSSAGGSSAGGRPAGRDREHDGEPMDPSDGPDLRGRGSPPGPPGRGRTDTGTEGAAPAGEDSREEQPAQAELVGDGPAQGASVSAEGTATRGSRRFRWGGQS